MRKASFFLRRALDDGDTTSGVAASFVLRRVFEGDAMSDAALAPPSFFVRRALEGDETSGVLDACLCWCFAVGEVSRVASLTLFF